MRFDDRSIPPPGECYPPPLSAFTVSLFGRSGVTFTFRGCFFVVSFSVRRIAVAEIRSFSINRAVNTIFEKSKRSITLERRSLEDLVISFFILNFGNV